MKFKELLNIFDEDFQLREVLNKIGDQGNEARKILDAHIASLQKSPGFEKANKVGENINILTCDHSEVYFLAGFVVGQAFDVVNREALSEIKFMQKQITDVLGCWPRKKEATEKPGKRP